MCGNWAVEEDARRMKIDEPTILKAVELIKRVAPASTIILFGSYARGDAREGSDLDFSVIEPEVKTRHEEMVRLRDALRPLKAPVDVLVASRQNFDQWADTPGTLFFEAAREGCVFHAVS